MNVTQRELDVLALIRDHRHRHGFAPTLRELADVLGTSHVTVREHVLNLARHGIIRYERYKNRSIEIIADVLPRKPLPRLPVLGIIGHWREKERSL